MRCILLAALLSFFVLGGCEKKEERTVAPATVKKAHQPPQPLATKPFLKAALAPVRVETATEALVAWRSYRQARPTLVMLSNDPFVAPIPEKLQRAVRTAVSETTEKEFHKVVDHHSPAPLLLPPMTVRAALENRFFSRMIWVLPVKDSKENFSWDQVSRQLVEQNFPNAENFTASESGLSGNIGDTVVDIVHAGTLPSVPGPAIIHIDLSYFAPLYDGEIKTPLYPLLHRTLATLRKAELKVAAATVCPGNFGRRLPLDTRFLANDLEAILREPSLLDGQPPLKWRQRAQALYLENFMQNTKIYEIYLDLEKSHPADASIKFALYEVLRKKKLGTEALEKLDQTVAIDPVYALEFLNLASVALEKNNPEAAIQMFQKAIRAFPDDPFVKLLIARAYLSLDMESHGRPLMNELKQLDWSPVYYPDLHRMATNGD